MLGGVVFGLGLCFGINNTKGSFVFKLKKTQRPNL